MLLQVASLMMMVMMVTMMMMMMMTATITRMTMTIGFTFIRSSFIFLLLHIALDTFSCKKSR